MKVGIHHLQSQFHKTDKKGKLYINNLCTPRITLKEGVIFKIKFPLGQINI